jgi:uncharacterized membrane protein
MIQNMKPFRRLWLLLLILLVGTGLRFWNLDSKPLWLDEVITSLFSLGQSFDRLPLDRALPLAELDQIFVLNPATTCPQIVQNVSTQSVHPPLFFCWMHQWMVGLSGVPLPWVWKLRSLPAIAGVVAILAIYCLNRMAFFPRAGLVGSALMAVSPFAVYLSQEARHYTTPMLLVILALMGLYQIHQDLLQQRLRPLIWLGWIAVNSLGFYVHYFFLIAFFAQVITLVVNVLSLKYLPALSPFPLNLRRSLAIVALASITVCLTYLPWLPTLMQHLHSPETDWLAQGNLWTRAIAPLYQIPIGWILMVIALPVEDQPIFIAAPAIALTMVFAGWLLWQIRERFGLLWGNPSTHLPARMLVVFVLAVLVQFLAIVYVLGKDITQVPRYNFLYYPAVCALLGATLSVPPGDKHSKTGVFRWKGRVSNRGVILIVLLVGIISSGLTVNNLVFRKPYRPAEAAQNMRVEPAKPLLLSMAYLDNQDKALGLSFALALRHQSQTPYQDHFALVTRSQGYNPLWQELAQIAQSLPLPLNLWLIGPGLKQSHYLPFLGQITSPTCAIDPDHYHRLGVPYQMYRCNRR